MSKDWRPHSAHLVAERASEPRNNAVHVAHLFQRALRIARRPIESLIANNHTYSQGNCLVEQVDQSAVALEKVVVAED